MKQPVVLILGPLRSAVSGVSTHLNLLFGSALERHFRMVQFQVGSAGRVESLPGRAWRLLASPFQLGAALRRQCASILHINTSLDAKAYWRDLVYVLVAKLLGVRVLYQIHGGAIRVFAANAAMRKILAQTLTWPDVVVVISQVELESARALAPRQRIELLPNGTNTELPLPRAASSAAASAAAPLRLVYIGRLVRTKGIFESLQALKLLRDRGVAARLAIAGSGPVDAALRQSAIDLGVQDLVSFAGATFGERKARLLAEADVLMLPTYHLEGLPYALLEGMAAGLVPVVTRVGAIPDVVQQDVHGLYVPPRDPQALAGALEALAADRAALERMSAAARERVFTYYSVDRVAGDFTTLYRKLAPG
jgi:glycosyltransferase involved in cell wall biosynthesis